MAPRSVITHSFSSYQTRLYLSFSHLGNTGEEVIATNSILYLKGKWIRFRVYFTFTHHKSSCVQENKGTFQTQNPVHKTYLLLSFLKIDSSFISSFFCFVFSVRLLSVLRGHSVFFIPATTANDLRLRRSLYPRFYPSHLFSFLNPWERASIFPFECSVLNKGTTGTIFFNVFGMTRSLTWGWIRDLPHSKPVLYN